MKPKITPRDHEIKLTEEDVIISKTDTRGVITYANRTFMRIAGYSERQLLEVQHNIIRHPDMPRGAFQLLWDTIKSGREFFGFVKNMTADGSYYWVFANVTPDLDAQGRVTGYFSVRRRPSPEAVNTVTGIYREMLEAERRTSAAQACQASIALLRAKLAAAGSDYERFVLGLYHG